MCKLSRADRQRKGKEIAMQEKQKPNAADTDNNKKKDNTELSDKELGKVTGGLSSMVSQVIKSFGEAVKASGRGS
jgi:hypothetical protein